MNKFQELRKEITDLTDEQLDDELQRPNESWESGVLRESMRRVLSKLNQLIPKPEDTRPLQKEVNYGLSGKLVSVCCGALLTSTYKEPYEEDGKQKTRKVMFEDEKVHCEKCSKPCEITRIQSSSEKGRDHSVFKKKAESTQLEEKK